MKITRTQIVKLGILVTISVAVFVVAIYYLGRQQNLFKSNVEISAYFDDIKGLKVGNNVRFLGINVGSISDITIVSDTVIRVDMAINKDVVKYIKSDSKVEIDSDGLMGNRIVVIFPGNADSPKASEGDILTSREIPSVEDLVREARLIIQRGTEISTNLLDITNEIKSGEGNLGRLIYDNQMIGNLGKASENLLDVSNQLSTVGQKLNNGKGDFAKLLNNDTITTQMNNVMKVLESTTQKTNQMAQNILYTTEQINNGKGLINKLIFDSSLSNTIDSTIINLNSGIDSLVIATETINDAWILNVFSRDKKKEK